MGIGKRVTENLDPSKKKAEETIYLPEEPKFSLARVTCAFVRLFCLCFIFRPTRSRSRHNKYSPNKSPLLQLPRKIRLSA